MKSRPIHPRQHKELAIGDIVYFRTSCMNFNQGDSAKVTKFLIKNGKPAYVTVEGNSMLIPFYYFCKKEI
jgi:hypothetical protein